MSEVHFDARFGWQYRNHGGDMCGCTPPFASSDAAVSYALHRLQASDSWVSQIIDARAALEFALSKKIEEAKNGVAELTAHLTPHSDS